MEIELNIKTPKLEFLRDVYTTMGRRLEHYRQLATGAIFGVVAIFILAVNAIEKWRSATAKPAADAVEKDSAIWELVVIVIIVSAITYFAARIVRRASANFREVCSLVMKIEHIFKAHEIGVYLPGEKLFPPDWPSDYKDPQAWREDIIPLAYNLIVMLWIIFVIYAFMRGLNFLNS